MAASLAIVIAIMDYGGYLDPDPETRETRARRIFPYWAHNLLEYSHRGGRPNIAARFPFDTRTSTVNKVVALDAPLAEYSWNTP